MLKKIMAASAGLWILPEDLEFIRAGYRSALTARMDFSWRDVLKIIEDHPELAADKCGSYAQII